MPRPLMWPLLLVAVTLLFGCARQPKPTIETLRIGTAAGPATLDPGMAQSQIELDVAGQLFATLVDLDVLDGKPQPGLASGWTVSVDRTVFTFRLRPDAYWSDGTRVTARDAAVAIGRVLRRGASSLTGANGLAVIAGAEEYAKAVDARIAPTGAVVVNEETLEIHTKEPAMRLLAALAWPANAPVPSERVRKHGEQWAELPHIVTSGALSPVEWEAGKRLVVERNPKFYGAAGGVVARLEFVFSGDSGQSVDEYSSGSLDVVYAPLPSGEPMRYHPKLKHDFVIRPDGYVHFLVFNVRKPPFNQARVRKAFAMVIDRGAVTNSQREGWRAATSLLPPDLYASDLYAPLPTPTPVPQGATPPPDQRQLLTEAGYPENRPFGKVTAMFGTSDEQHQLAQQLTSMWQAGLGITVTPEFHEPSSFLQRLDQDAPEIFYLAWRGDYRDAYAWMGELFHSDAAFNFGGFNNAEFDRWVDRAEAEPILPRRREYQRAADALLTESEAAAVPLYYGGRVVLMKPWVAPAASAHSAENWARWRISRPGD